MPEKEAAATMRAAEAIKAAETMNAIAENAERKLHQLATKSSTSGSNLFSGTVVNVLVMLLIGGIIGAIAWGVMGGRDKTPPAEVVVQVAPQPVIVEQVVPPAPPQPAYQSPFRDIFEAAEKGMVRDVEYFIKNGANVNARRNKGGAPWEQNVTPLHESAANNSNVEVVRYLVSQGADVNARCGHGWAPIHVAAKHNTVAVVEYFISLGYDVNTRNSYHNQMTLLHCAAWENPNVEMVRYLVSQGADVNARNGSNMTPIHEASLRTTNLEVLRYLVSVPGADVNARARDGITTPYDVADRDTGRQTEAKRAILRAAGGRSGR